MRILSSSYNFRMFHSSKQRQMLFKSEVEIQEIRNKVNQDFKNSHPECAEFFISAEDERLLCRKFERELLRFCNVGWLKLC